ncbi:hypothetical protein LTS10_000310 [Elasticomyces elasticus]|nr:hypothetical protein LTS10_000310 [Elasticomyces elasticus]
MPGKRRREDDGDVGPAKKKSPKWIANKKYKNYLAKCRRTKQEPTHDRDYFLSYPDPRHEPFVDDHEPDDPCDEPHDPCDEPMPEPIFADARSSNKARKREMKALLRAGREPEITSSKDREMWERVKAKQRPIVTDEQQNPHVEAELGATPDHDGELRSVADNEIAIDEFQLIDDIVPEPENFMARFTFDSSTKDAEEDTIESAASVSDDSSTEPNDLDVYDLVPENLLPIKQQLVAHVDDAAYLSRHGYDPTTVSNTIFTECSREHHRLQCYQAFATPQNYVVAEQLKFLAGSWSDVQQGCVPLHKLGLKSDRKSASTDCSDCGQKIRITTSLHRLLVSLKVPTNELWRMVVETSNRAPMYQTSHQCNLYQGDKVCLHSDHFELESTPANATRAQHHNGRHGCYDKKACFGFLVRREQPTDIDKLDLASIQLADHAAAVKVEQAKKRSGLSIMRDEELANRQVEQALGLGRNMENRCERCRKWKKRCWRDHGPDEACRRCRESHADCD